jgi:hypothetical protein
MDSFRKAFQDQPRAGRLKEQRRLTSLASSRALPGDALLTQITPQFLILVAKSAADSLDLRVH